MKEYERDKSHMDTQGVKCNEVTPELLAEISTTVKREHKRNWMQIWAYMFAAILSVAILNFQESSVNEQWLSITVQVLNVILSLLVTGTLVFIVWPISSINITRDVIPLIAGQRAALETIPAIEETYGIFLSEESKMNIPHEDTVRIADAVPVTFTEKTDGSIGIGFIERKNDTFFLHRAGG